MTERQVRIRDMNMTKNLVILAGAALATGMVLTPSASATQAGDPYRCQAGNVCVWEHTNFDGGLAQFDLVKLNYQYEIYDNGVSVNDTASSIYNRSSHPINFYWNSGANIRDKCVTVQPNSTIGNLAAHGCDNSLSSHYSANL